MYTDDSSTAYSKYFEEKPKETTFVYFVVYQLAISKKKMNESWEI